jgi:hypothetical protein
VKITLAPACFRPAHGPRPPIEIVFGELTTLGRWAALARRFPSESLASARAQESRAGMKRSSPIVGGQRPPPGLRPSDAPCLEPAPATDVRAHLILALRTMFVAWSAKVGSVPVILLMGRPFTVAPGDDLCLRDRFGALAWADASRSICGRK